jgi:hypothetical protein
MGSFYAIVASEISTTGASNVCATHRKSAFWQFDISVKALLKKG